MSDEYHSFADVDWQADAELTLRAARNAGHLRDYVLGGRNKKRDLTKQYGRKPLRGKLSHRSLLSFDEVDD